MDISNWIAIAALFIAVVGVFYSHKSLKLHDKEIEQAKSLGGKGISLAEKANENAKTANLIAEDALEHSVNHAQSEWEIKPNTSPLSIRLCNISTVTATNISVRITSNGNTLADTTSLKLPGGTELIIELAQPLDESGKGLRFATGEDGFRGVHLKAVVTYQVEDTKIKITQLVENIITEFTQNVFIGRRRIHN